MFWLVYFLSLCLLEIPTEQPCPPEQCCGWALLFKWKCSSSQVHEQSLSLLSEQLSLSIFNVEVKTNHEIWNWNVLFVVFKRDITKFKPLSSRTAVSVITGDSFDQEIPEHLNQVRAQLQDALVTLLLDNTVVKSIINLFPAPDGSQASKEVSGGVLPISQSHSHKRSRPANDLQEAICHQPAPEEASPPTTSQTAERVTRGQHVTIPPDTHRVVV